MKNIDYHQNELDDYVVDVEQEHLLNHEHLLQDAPELTMAKEENLLLVVVEQQQLAVVDYYLLVKINDILDMLYLVQANFEDNFDGINDHLKKFIFYKIE
jgi:hypothetical protein